MRRGRGLLLAEENEHLRHVGDVLGAQVPGLLVRLRVVVALGQPEAALERRSDDVGRVLAVGLRAVLEGGIHPVGLEPRDLGLQGRDVLDRGDTRELVFERPRALRFDRGLVHAARPEVAELALLGAFGAGVCGEPFQNLMEGLPVALVQLVERAPARVVGGNGIGLEPASHRVLIEVLARSRALVHVRRLESARSPSRRRHCVGRRDRQGQDEKGCCCSELRQGRLLWSLSETYATGAQRFYQAAFPEGWTK